MCSPLAIVICNRKLQQLCTIHETIRIKSGAWDEKNIFIYSTLTHIKYLLINGDNGIVRTLDQPLYITGVKGSKIYCLDRECKNRTISVDTTEYVFKHALINRNYSQLLRMVKEFSLIGQSIISYLQKKGYPEVALLFVKDEKTRFTLAVECGNIEVALEAAKTLDDKDCWDQLGREALRQGNHQIVEMAYQRTNNFDRLSFLYLITGNQAKLRKMLKISDMRNDLMGKFHNSLYLGEIPERIQLLQSVGQLALAYSLAKTHGFEEQAEQIATLLDGKVPDVKPGQLLVGPTPLMRLHQANWPLLTVSKGYFQGQSLAALEKQDTSATKVAAEPIDMTDANWGDDGLDLDDEGVEKRPEQRDHDDEEPSLDAEGSAWDVSLDMEEEVDLTPAKAEKTSFVSLPSKGPSISQLWTNNSNLAVDHVAAGSFDTAFRVLLSSFDV